jgi:hypothetical protein
MVRWNEAAQITYLSNENNGEVVWNANLAFSPAPCYIDGIHVAGFLVHITEI